MKRAIIAIFSLVLLLNLCRIDSYAASTKKEEYELQERCSKQAEEFFVRQYGTRTEPTPTGWARRDYAHHYNRKLNRCFILVTEKYFIEKEKSRQIFGPAGAENSRQIFKNLYDVIDGKHYANFYARTMIEEPETGLLYDRDLLKKPLSCMVIVLDRECESEVEWDRLVKPYMEE
jgi:hypothetical protein